MLAQLGDDLGATFEQLGVAHDYEEALQRNVGVIVGGGGGGGGNGADALRALVAKAEALIALVEMLQKASNICTLVRRNEGSVSGVLFYLVLVNGCFAPKRCETSNRGHPKEGVL